MFGSLKKNNFKQMAESIYCSIHKARKDHHDNSAEFIDTAMDYIRSSGKLTFSELRSIAQLKANGWKIKKWQLYERQLNKIDGDVYTFKSLLEIIKICQKLNLYAE